jgi:hypothetical protein
MALKIYVHLLWYFKLLCCEAHSSRIKYNINLLSKLSNSNFLSAAEHLLYSVMDQQYILQEYKLFLQ